MRITNTIVANAVAARRRMMIGLNAVSGLAKGSVVFVRPYWETENKCGDAKPQKVKVKEVGTSAPVMVEVAYPGGLSSRWMKAADVYGSADEARSAFKSKYQTALKVGDTVRPYGHRPGIVTGVVTKVFGKDWKYVIKWDDGTSSTEEWGSTITL